MIKVWNIDGIALILVFNDALSAVNMLQIW